MSAPEEISPETASFLKRLEEEGFDGEASAQLGERLVYATDNSLYQQRPAAVLYPRVPSDLNRAVRAAQDGRLTLAIRGGGTGTNGQSLTSGVVLDVSRHMDRIEAFDPEAQIVTVGPGVILSRLNAFLKPHGFFFPPMVSTANRATIGGMIATDASGKGSRRYGKTSDYIEALDVVLSDGSDLTVRCLSPEELTEQMRGETLAARLHREVYRVVTQHADEIARTFPKMNRGLTGYNLQNILLPDGRFDLTRLLAGSEGTLALTKRIVLRVRKIPAHRRLVVIRYGDFDQTLRHVQNLLSLDPLAVEVLDDRLLDAARQDVSWGALERLLGGISARAVKGLSFVEFVGDDEESLSRSLARAASLLAEAPSSVIDYTAVTDESDIAQLWSLRATAVGLLGKPQDGRQGAAFVEDTAVPPENLADYTAEFRAILDAHALTYGMFGHADVGCLHVRPFLNMLDERERSLIRPITDQVAALTRRYGGLLWGEHGRGYRGEFSPLFFGETLFAELCRIKAVFDPKDLFNRGKLVPVAPYAVDRIDGVPFKGRFDAEIAPALRAAFTGAVACNGNGACFNQEPEIALCPSYKATKDRTQSPKGRATLLRAWLRLSSLAAENPERRSLPVLTRQLAASLSTCLSCKACATQCPVQVDIPSMRAKFWAAYYRRRGRPLKDYLVYWLESFLALGRKAPGTANVLLHNGLSRRLLSWIGLVDLPVFAPARLPAAARMTRDWRRHPPRKALLLLQDSFTGSFEGELVEWAYALFSHLGYDVRVAPVWKNGKARYVLGFRRGFERIARRLLGNLAVLAESGLTVLTLDAASGLMFGQEYAEISQSAPLPDILSVEHFLDREIKAGRLPVLKAVCTDPVKILPHCTEQALTPRTMEEWRSIFHYFGLPAKIIRAGCCGMAGIFGHEKKNAALSREIFRENWQSRVDDACLATGFSCRCQSERMTGRALRHPLVRLAETLGVTRGAE